MIGQVAELRLIAAVIHVEMLVGKSGMVAVCRFERNFLSLLLAALTGFCGGCEPRAETTAALRLAVTTSTRDSGLLDVLIPQFEKANSVRVDVVAVGTGAALKLGETGDADVVLVHAREAEDAFMRAGHGSRYEEVMYNTFELLGPKHDPSEIGSLDPVQALKAIASGAHPFVSRGDRSGTHQRELQLWKHSGEVPSWLDYIETGRGMGATLVMADQLNAYVLSDRGTYLRFKSKLALVPLIKSSELLKNPYGIMVVNPEKHVGTNSKVAHRFVDFMISRDVQEQILEYRVAGESLFYPLRLSPRTKSL